jgi:hypothetical protein
MCLFTVYNGIPGIRRIRMELNFRTGENLTSSFESKKEKAHLLVFREDKLAPSKTAGDIFNMLPRFESS